MKKIMTTLTVFTTICLILSFASLLYIGCAPKNTIPASLEECGMGTKTNDNDVIYYQYHCRFIDKNGEANIQYYEKEPFESMAKEPKGKVFMVKEDEFSGYKIYIFYIFMISAFFSILFFSIYKNPNKIELN